MASLEGEEAKGAALRDHRERQRRFLKRAAEPEGPATWRPRKRHRKAAFQVAAHMHRVFREWFDKGLLYYQQQSDVSQRPPAISWPRLSLCPDMGF